MSIAAVSRIQRHLTVAFPIKSPAEAKALGQKLPLLMPDFAEAQDTEGFVHYSRFLALSDKALLFIADVDGEADELIGTLAKSAAPVFDAIFEHVENPPLTPVANNSEAFVIWMKHHNIQPLVAYSAYAGNSVKNIKSCARSAGFTGNSEQHPLLLSLPIKSSLKAFVLEELVLRATRGKMNEGADSVGLHFAHFVPFRKITWAFLPSSTVLSINTYRTSRRKSDRFSTLFLNLSVGRRQPRWQRTPRHSLAGPWQATYRPSGCTALTRAWRFKTSTTSSATREWELLRSRDNGTAFRGAPI